MFITLQSKLVASDVYFCYFLVLNYVDMYQNIKTWIPDIIVHAGDRSDLTAADKEAEVGEPSEGESSTSQQPEKSEVSGE